jgi:hypothetical protein
MHMKSKIGKGDITAMNLNLPDVYRKMIDTNISITSIKN